MIQIKQMLVSSRAVTSGEGNPCNYIVIHETANTSKGANALMHATLQRNGFTASWHYTVDEKNIYQSYPDTVKCWHAGDGGNGKGNGQGIGIEICVNSDGDFKRAVENAAELVKHLMKKHNIPQKNVIQHNVTSSWGKNCPANLRSGKIVSWADFNRMIDGSGGTVSAPETETKPSKVAKPKKKTGNARIRTIQSTLNSRYNTGLKVDGFNGPLTKKALIKGLQTELNKQFNAKLSVDGLWGPKTANACVTVRKGARGNLTWLIQARLYCLGYDPEGLDGIFGDGLYKAVYAFQTDKDGIPGKKTFAKLFG